MPARPRCACAVRAAGCSPSPRGARCGGVGTAPALPAAAAARAPWRVPGGSRRGSRCCGGRAPGWGPPPFPRAPPGTAPRLAQRARVPCSRSARCGSCVRCPRPCTCTWRAAACSACWRRRPRAAWLRPGAGWRARRSCVHASLRGTFVWAARRACAGGRCTPWASTALWSVGVACAWLTQLQLTLTGRLGCCTPLPLRRPQARPSLPWLGAWSCLPAHALGCAAAPAPRGLRRPLPLLGAAVAPVALPPLLPLPLARPPCPASLHSGSCLPRGQLWRSGWLWRRLCTCAHSAHTAIDSCPLRLLRCRRACLREAAPLRAPAGPAGPRTRQWQVRVWGCEACAYASSALGQGVPVLLCAVRAGVPGACLAWWLGVAHRRTGLRPSAGAPEAHW